MRMRIRSLLAIVISAVLMLTACTGHSPSSSSQGVGAAKSTESDNTLTIAMSVNLTSFDIHNQTNGYREGIFNNIFNYLVKRDNKGQIQPDLAEKYEKKDDTTWHFTLRKGVKFHNGDPLTSEDVKFSLERVARDEKLSQQSSYKQIQEVKIIDDLNFDIITSAPDPVLLYRVARIGSGILPKKYIEKVGWEEFSKNPVGTGPYQFVENKLDDKLVLKKFDGYFEGKVSDWDTLVFRIVPEASTRVSELLTGGVDIAAEIPPADWDRVNNHHGTKVLSSDSTTVMALAARSMPGSPTSDVRVRQAIDYAIDNKMIIDNLFKGTATPTRTRVTPGNWAWDESLFNSYRYDPAKSKELLKEAGYANGLDITLQTPQGSNLLDTDVAQMVAGMLTQVGIRTRVEILESSRFSDLYNTGKGKELMMNSNSNSMFDASHALAGYNSKTASKSVGYNNPAVDELLNKAQINMNEQERKEQYYKVQEMVAEDVPFINLYLQKYYTGASDRVSFEPRIDRAYIAREIKKVK